MSVIFGPSHACRSHLAVSHSIISKHAWVHVTAGRGAYTAVQRDLVVLCLGREVDASDRVCAAGKSIGISSNHSIAIVVAQARQLLGIFRAYQDVLASISQPAQRQAIRNELECGSVVRKSHRSDVGHAG